MSTYGQINTVDIGYYNYTPFTLIGGTDDLCSWNMNKKHKGATITASTSSIGAATASRLSPKLDLIAFATGTDWCKGMHELDNLKRPKVAVIRVSQSDLREWTVK